MTKPMWFLSLILSLAAVVIPTLAQNDEEGPTNEKAQRTFKQAQDYVHQHLTGAALESFKKADKQDDGHCVACQKKMIKYGIELGEWKTAETAAEQRVTAAQGAKDLALAHYQLGTVLTDEALSKRKDEVFARAHEEMTKALLSAPNFPEAIFVDGQILAHLKQDDAAKKQLPAERLAEFEKARDATLMISCCPGCCSASCCAVRMRRQPSPGWIPRMRRAASIAPCHC